MNDWMIKSTAKKRHNLSWSVSYGDLITVLLVFFIIITASSNINSKKFEQIQKLIQGQSAKLNDLSKVMKDLEKLLLKHNLASYVTLAESPNGILLIIKDNLLFKSGEAQIPEHGRENLKPIFEALKELPSFYKFSIEGHTDDEPINTPRFSSNWHLSAARALSLLELFSENSFDRKRLSMHGFADTKPLFPNRDKFGNALKDNQTKNRRVVIRVK